MIYIYIGQCERWAREKANGKGEGKITTGRLPIQNGGQFSRGKAISPSAF